MSRRKQITDASQKKTVRRRIFFCRLDGGFGSNGKPQTPDLTNALAAIGALPFSPEGRYLRAEQEDGRDLCLWIDRSTFPFRLRLANIRRGDFPPVEKDGELSPLLLQGGGGLAEQTHFVIFANGIVGCEYSHFGPRHNALGYYVKLKADGLCLPFRLNVLVRRDIERQLASLRDVRLIQLKVRSSFINTIEEADKDLGAAFRASARAIEAENSDEIELVLKRKKRKGRAFWNDVISVVQNLAAKPELKEQVSKFKVSGFADTESRLVDVLSEQISIEKQIESTGAVSKAVDDDSAYKAIEAAYAETEAELLVAAELAS